MPDAKKIVVIGAGVAGLTSALQLSKNGYDVTVVAKFMPGDYDIEYTSPWAGANWMSFVKDNERLANYDRITYGVFQKLIKECPDAGIWPQRCITYVRPEDLNKKSDLLGGLLDARPWFADLVENFTMLDSSTVPKGYSQGIAYDSVCINVQVYLPWLQSQCLANGVKLKAVTLKHIKEAVNLHWSGHKAELVVNCTGLFASRLGGVMDSKMYPGRGQTVLVRNHAPAMYNVSGTADGEDELTYIMSRPGGGTILGGCYQKGNWNGAVDPNLAERIIKRSLELCPELEKEFPLDIVRHNVGLRPSREGGPRVELEELDGVGKVVHNYGAGGAGYQSSYGMADHVVELVELAFKER
ncbi:FAD dependent oxidoreductase [Lipomyces tetrasporus]|uniref:FAD dependent oxidoreductase n=1 Tax=Lipomyces tetrasporus TaxID=54092 RepID=A0AAD7QRI3_9ASCO|nr:FAD dependent oxidoreductase [Lipomyces tetrasporus]KAJ8099636.1 FAD dependent oxidoreductase [Lipomyces tetrasporus]